MTTNPEAGMRLEDAAQALFRRAQGIYREDHDHFPLKHSWETLNEKLRDGWRSMARVAIEAAAPVAPAGSDGEVVRRWLADVVPLSVSSLICEAHVTELVSALAARAQPPAGEAVAWIIEDLILPYVSITQDRRYADMKRDYRYEGEPTAKVTPLYAHPTEPAARDGREALQQIVDDLRIAVPGLRDALMACQTDVRELMADLETQKPISLAKTEIFGKLEFPVIHVEQALRMGEDWLSSPPASGEVQNG